MKNLIYCFFLACCLSSCAASLDYTAGTPTYYRVTQPHARIYRHAAVIDADGTAINQNEKLLVVGRKAPNWYVIKRDGVIYYILGEYVLMDDTPSYQASGAGGSSGSRSSYHNIQTGPRGGKYYINSHGNKTYIKH